jgi:hypothetical protein
MVEKNQSTGALQPNRDISYAANNYPGFLFITFFGKDG